jgi:AcrR family transcriptional regulator
MPSENAGTSVVPPVDRRSRKRAARTDHLLDLAADIVADQGVDGLTMTALAEAADYATASLYTYFPSRSALLAALQQRALRTLGAVASDRVAIWDADLRARPVASDLALLARLWAFSDLFLAAPEQHPREFLLQQQLLVSAGAETIDDAASVVPAAMAVLAVPRRLVAEAAVGGALAVGDTGVDAVHDLVDRPTVRTLAWIVSLNGALLTDRLSTGLPSTGASLGSEITGALLRGWGADQATTAAARTHAHGWRTLGAPR